MAGPEERAERLGLALRPNLGVPAGGWVDPCLAAARKEKRAHVLMAQSTRASFREPGPQPASNEFPCSRIIREFCDHHRLTPRERQIVAMVCRGLKNTQIGTELGVSNATIRLHIGNIHRKLSTTSKVDLVLMLWQWACRDGGGAG